MYASLKASDIDNESWIFFWLESSYALWDLSIFCSCIQAVSFKLMVIFFQETLLLLFVISRNLTLTELKHMGSVVYKQNRFVGFVRPDDEEEIGAAGSDEEQSDPYGQPIDHLYKVIE